MRAALFGGTLLACGMTAENASAQSLLDISGTDGASAYIYAYPGVVAYADNPSPGGIAMAATALENSISASLGSAGLQATISTPRRAYSNYNSGNIYALGSRFTVSEATESLAFSWDFDANAFFIPVREVRLSVVNGPTIFEVSTLTPSDPKSGTQEIPVSPGVLYELDVYMSYLGNVGEVFVTMTPIGSGTPCVGDLDGSGDVNGADLGTLLGAWSTSTADLNGDGTTDGADLAILLGAWGNCPG